MRQFHPAHRDDHRNFVYFYSAILDPIDSITDEISTLLIKATLIFSSKVNKNKFENFKASSTTHLRDFYWIYDEAIKNNQLMCGEIKNS